jgi:Yip1 domain
MLCPKCKKPVDGNAAFCGACGQRVDAGAGQPPLGATLVMSAASAASVVTAPAPEPLASTAASGIFQRIKNIVLSPSSEWAVIAPEPTSIALLFTGYAAPLAAFAAVISFTRMSLLGVSVPFGATFRTPIMSGLIYALAAFGFGLLGVFLIGLIINSLAPTFSGQRDQRQALKVAAYSLTPAWLSTVFGLLPAFSTLLQLIAGMYGIYVLYLGLPVLMRSPREKALGYTATVVICTILMGIVFGVLSAASGRFAHLGGGSAFAGTSGAAAFGADPTSAAAARDRGVSSLGNSIGAALGTDDKGKEGITAALSNLAKAGEQAKTEQASQPQGAAPTADQAQNAMAATTGLMTALGGALGGPHRVDPVDSQTLRGMLPASVPGMKRTDTAGESNQAIGIKTTSAKANYAGADGATAQIEITDQSAVSGLMDVAGSLIKNTTSESDSGYERDAALNGRVVHEKYDAKAKKADLDIIIAKRFDVHVSGDGIPMSTAEQALGQVDLSRLESMKDQGAAAR